MLSEAMTLDAGPLCPQVYLDQRTAKASFDFGLESKRRSRNLKYIDMYVFNIWPINF
jgi:hypothetical protein